MHDQQHGMTTHLCLNTAPIEFSSLKFGDVIGRGSFGVVHKGEYHGSEVALKRIKLPPGVSPSSLPTPKEISVLK